MGTLGLGATHIPLRLLQVQAMFLIKSESLGPRSNLFSVLDDRRHCLFVRLQLDHPSALPSTGRGGGFRV